MKLLYPCVSPFISTFPNCVSLFSFSFLFSCCIFLSGEKLVKQDDYDYKDTQDDLAVFELLPHSSFFFRRKFASFLFIFPTQHFPSSWLFLLFSFQAGRKICLNDMIIII